jgi:hypothetical protein
MNSTRTRDSANLTESGEASSGATSGPPYAIAGTYSGQSALICGQLTGKTVVHTLLAGFTFGAYHSGLFTKSISHLLNVAPTSARAISVCVGCVTRILSRLIMKYPLSVRTYLCYTSQCQGLLISYCMHLCGVKRDLFWSHLRKGT